MGEKEGGDNGLATPAGRVNSAWSPVRARTNETVTQRSTLLIDPRAT